MDSERSDSLELVYNAVQAANVAQEAYQAKTAESDPFWQANTAARRAAMLAAGRHILTHPEDLAEVVTSLCYDGKLTSSSVDAIAREIGQAVADQIREEARE